MSLVRNLVRACAQNDISLLFVGTKQIFGLCDTYGVDDTLVLFYKYCSVVQSCLNFLSEDTVVESFNDMVWETKQTSLADLLGYRRGQWKSMLTYDCDSDYNH